MAFRLNRALLLSTLALGITACGGGDDGAPASTELPEGIFGGTLTGSASSDFQMLVLENGELWSLYGTETSTSFGVAGFIQATIGPSGSSFSSTNVRDYGFAPAVAGTATGTFNQAAGTISGSVSAGGQSVSFSGGPIAGSLYNYNTPATISTISGGWTLDALNGETIVLNVQSDGSLSASSSGGCNFTGQVRPRNTGKNVFDTTITFGPAPCALPNQTGSGITVAYPISGGGTQLLVAVQDAARTVGTAAFGVR